MQKYQGIQTVIARDETEHQLRVWSDDGRTGHLFITGIAVERIAKSNGEDEQDGKWRLVDQGGMCSILA